MVEQSNKLLKKIENEDDDAKKWALFRSSTIKNTTFAISQIYNQKIDLVVLRDALTKQRDQILSGDSLKLEEMLVGQAQALEALFYMASEHISLCKSIDQMQAYVDLAIKANNSCRKTISALSHLQNPTNTVFIREQNNSSVQQVNNLMISKINSENELLKDLPNETLECGRTIETSSINSTMETVEVSRGKNIPRKRGK